MRKPPLTRTAPVMEVALTPTLAQATEAMGATDETGEDTHNTEYQRSFSQCENTTGGDFTLTN